MLTQKILRLGGSMKSKHFTNGAINCDYILFMQYLLHSVPAGLVRHQNHLIHFLELGPNFSIVQIHSLFQSTTKKGHRSAVYLISMKASSDPQSTNSSSLIIVILLDFCFFPWKDSDRSIFVRGTYAIASSSHSLLFYFYFVCWCDLFLRRDRTNRDREREKLRTR